MEEEIGTTNNEVYMIINDITRQENFGPRPRSQWPDLDDSDDENNRASDLSQGEDDMETTNKNDFIT